MKQLIKRSLAILLTLALMIGTIPYNASAANADNDYVLTSISHADTIAKVNVSGKFNATLTVPYDYAKVIDLSNGLDISYDKSTYYSAVASFPDGAEATVGGDAISMLVTYQYTETGDPFTSTYTINVQRTEPIDPKFSGTITKTTVLPSKITFSATDFTAKYKQNDGQPLGSITISGSNPSFGSLQLDGSDYVLEDQISYAKLSAGKLTFTTTASGTCDYRVDAYGENDTSNIIGTAVLRITVNQEVINAANITYTTSVDTAIKFRATDFSSVCTAATGDTLSYVNYTPPSSTYGKLYYNYISSTSPGTLVQTSTKYNVSANPSLSDITFVPYGYSGTFTISYVGQTIGGKEFNGKVQIIVNANTAATINYTTAKDDVITFDSYDFNRVCNDKTGGNLSYVKFTPPSSTYGILYYDYISSSNYDSKVSSTAKYYRNSSPYLDDVTFVPKSGYSGTVTITYIGYSTAAESYTGTIKITVVSDSSTTVISYSTAKDEAITFDSYDFNRVCNDKTGDNLSYVKFTPPSSTYGVLYYDYISPSRYDSKVASTAKYYRGSSPYLDDVTFVPKSGYSGTITITYTGYSTAAESYTGKIKITVSSTSSTTVISYTTARDEAITFDSYDFNRVCNDKTGDNLSYVKFTLPSSTYGILYYDYISSSRYDSKVASTTKYYRSSSPDLDDVTFVPKSGYTGTITITYTGYSTAAESFTGTVKIAVASTGSSLTISYTINEGEQITFDSADFNSVCNNITDYNLSYVKFTLPSSTYGILYYDYISSSRYDSKVASTTKYYRSSSPDLDDVTFVPKSGYIGTITITYTGYSTAAESYTGKIKITINTIAVKGSAYFNDVTSSYSWAAPSIDYLYSKGVVLGTGTNIYSPAANITRGDFMLMLCRGLKLSSSSATTNFPDVPKGSYYYTAISVAKALGIAQGSGGYFRPTDPITREDAMVLVVRAMKVTGKTLRTGSISDLSAFTDRSSISSYAVSAVASLVLENIITGNNGRLYPKSSITRAEMAVILYRVLQK